MDKALAILFNANSREIYNEILEDHGGEIEGSLLVAAVLNRIQWRLHEAGVK
jgi:hypothetical protein